MQLRIIIMPVETRGHTTPHMPVESNPHMPVETRGHATPHMPVDTKCWWLLTKCVGGCGQVAKAAVQSALTFKL